MTKIKICGITNKEDGLKAVELGADALGFIFYKKSPRYIQPELAKEIISNIPPLCTSVGIFVNEDENKIKEIVNYCGIDVIQLHGEENPDFCSRFDKKVVKAIGVKDSQSLHKMLTYKIWAFLLDTVSDNQCGGTGKIFNWDLAIEAKQYGLIILAGGLNLYNVAQAIKVVKPYAIDVSSGIEEYPGKKDHWKMERFIKNAKNAF